MAKLRKEDFTTGSNIPIDRIYGNDDAGAFPFTRGVYPEMYRARFWTMRQYAGFGSARESNKRYRYLLDSGTTGLSVAFDLPTQIGYDSDHSMASGEVGRVGVPIDSLEDIDILFDGIELEKVSTSMTINSTASILLAFYVAKAKQQGADLKKISGTIQNDILKEYAARGTYIYPPSASMRIITDIFSWCSKELPQWNTISISGYHIREAGSTAVEEIAFTLSNGLAYVKAAIDAGLDVDDFAPRISFFFNSHLNFFEEIAKFRAARRLWAKLMQERFAPKKIESLKLRFHSQTAGSSLTAQQIENNIVRTTIEAMAAVLGGTQSLHTNGKDEALALPTEQAAKTALRTQQVIAYESGIADTVDPLAGSYYVEYLTDELERRSRALIEDVDALGGAVKSIEVGFYQDKIAQSAFNYQKRVDAKEEVVVGVNQFIENETIEPDTLKIDPILEKEQVERVRSLRERRDYAKTSASLEAVRSAATSRENLMPHIVTAVESKATLGEIADIMRGVFGEYQG